MRATPFAELFSRIDFVGFFDRAGRPRILKKRFQVGFANTNGPTNTMDSQLPAPDRAPKMADRVSGHRANFLEHVQATASGRIRGFRIRFQVVLHATHSAHLPSAWRRRPERPGGQVREQPQADSFPRPDQGLLVWSGVMPKWLLALPQAYSDEAWGVHERSWREKGKRCVTYVTGTG
jgi:hypothetical protein